MTSSGSRDLILLIFLLHSLTKTFNILHKFLSPLKSGKFILSFIYGGFPFLRIYTKRPELPGRTITLPILPQNDFPLLKCDIPVPPHHINLFLSGFHDWYGNLSFPRRPGRKEILSHKKVRIASSSAGRCFYSKSRFFAGHAE